MSRNVSKVGDVSKNFIPLFLLLSFVSCSSAKHERETTETTPTVVEKKIETRPIILFFPKSDATGIVKMELKMEDPIKGNDQIIRQIVSGLTSPIDSSQYAIFPEKPEVYGTFVDKDILYVDFSATIKKANFQNIQMEQLALEALLSTIKINFPSIQQVKFLSEHEDTDLIFGHTYAQQPFSLKDL